MYMMTDMKHCPKCKQDKPPTDFYSYKRNGRTHLHCYCKPCHNPPSVKTKKPKGFDLLPEKQRVRIIKELGDRRLTTKMIAEIEGLNYANLTNWIRRGHIPLPVIDYDYTPDVPEIDVVNHNFEAEQERLRAEKASDD